MTLRILNTERGPISTKKGAQLLFNTPVFNADWMQGQSEYVA